MTDLTLAKTQSDEAPFQGVWGDSHVGGLGAGSEMAASTEEAKVPRAPGMWQARGSCQQGVQAAEGGAGEGLQPCDCQVLGPRGCEER